MSIATVSRKKGRKTPLKAAADGTLSMTFISDEEDVVRIPSWVRDLPTFRQWVQSPGTPEDLPAFFLDREVCLDMSKEQIYTHVDVKTEFAMVLRRIGKDSRRGRYLTDGVRLTNVKANLSSKPDGMFVLKETLETGRIRLIEGKKGGYVEMEGTPDMVLEIVSDSSVTKDLETLRDLYWKAGIPEYWLVDVRGDEVVFEIYRHSAKHYAATRKHDAWMKSNVFGTSVRLVRRQDEFGNPEFSLETK